MQTKQVPRKKQVRTTILPSSPVPTGQFNKTEANKTNVLTGGYLSSAEMEDRHLRFPSAQERVKLYMSSWYTPPCKRNDTAKAEYEEGDGLVQYAYLPSNESIGPQLLLLDAIPGNGSGAGEGSLAGHRRRLFLVNGTNVKGTVIFYLIPSDLRNCHDGYCNDVRSYIIPSLQRLQSLATMKVPVLLQFGDSELARAFLPSANKLVSYPSVPVIKKFRCSMSTKELQRITDRTCYQHMNRDTVANTVMGVRRLQPSK